jgi:NAD(P)-dependent dehydrogenase (short-subunit alcohol dehydrogenase family)
MMNLEAQTVMVTGASAGVGRSIAKAFAAAGARVGLLARGTAALEEVRAEIEAQGGQALVLTCDVADYSALQDAAAKLAAHFGPIDIWINNAMVTVFSPLVQMTPEEFRRVTDVTYHGAVYGSLIALQHMAPRNRGHIIQIGSALAYRAIPLQGAYCGAKHALKGFTESLHTELIHGKCAVQLSMVQLPAFNTPQFVWARNRTGHSAQPVAPIHDPALAAEAVLWIAQHPQRELWVGWPTWKAILGERFIPGLLDRFVARVTWEGQFAGRDANPGKPHNLFNAVDGVHSERGPFTDRSRTRRPALWHVRNHNGWIIGLGLLLMAAFFVAGYLVGR